MLGGVAAAVLVPCRGARERAARRELSGHLGISATFHRDSLRVATTRVWSAAAARSGRARGAADGNVMERGGGWTGGTRLAGAYVRG